MTAVLDDVEGRHGGVAESVDEDGLIFTLQEVEGEKAAEEDLQVRRFRDGLVEVEVEVRSEGKEEQGRDEHGSEIFDDEDGAPADLRAQILDLEHIFLAQAGAGDCVVLGIRHQAPVTGFSDSQAVDGEARHFGERLVNLLGRRVRRDLNLLGDFLAEFAYIDPSMSV